MGGHFGAFPLFRRHTSKNKRDWELTFCVLCVILNTSKERGIPNMKKSTKRFLVFVLSICIVGFGAFCCGWMRGEAFDPTSTYEAPARVDEINDSTGWVTLVDWAGESWCIRGDGYEIGQLVIAVFNDHNTPDYIYDDTIDQVKCLANIEHVE